MTCRYNRVQADHTRKPPRYPHATRAAILCGEPAFQAFIELRHRCGPALEILETAKEKAEVTASRLREILDIASRKELDEEPDAWQRFLDLETEYLQATGRIAEARG